MQLRGLALTLLALGPLGGCRSAWYGANFMPAPLEVQVLAEGEPLAQARALVRVRGIRRARPSEGFGPEVELLLRLDNLGAAPLELCADGLDLVTADLISLGAPRVEPAPGESIAPDEDRVYTLNFPMPEDRDVEDLDWGGLNFKWKVRFGEREAVTGVTFDRDQSPAYWGGGYYDPFYPGPWPRHSTVRVGVGVGN